MAQLQQPFGEAELVHDLHDGRVQRVTAKLPIKVRVRLQERYVHPFARQQQRQYRPTRTATDHTASRSPYVLDSIRRCGLSGGRFRVDSHLQNSFPGDVGSSVTMRTTAGLLYLSCLSPGEP